MSDYQQNFIGKKSVRTCGPYSTDPNKHTFIDYKDTCGNYPDYRIRLPDEDVFIALDSLYYDIVDFLQDEFYQSIDSDVNQYIKGNYELVKKHLQVLDFLKRFIKSDSTDLFDWCEQYDEVNNTNITKLIKEWLEK